MVGQFIKKHREAQGMSQPELYKDLPTQRRRNKSDNHNGASVISRIENGKISISFEQFVSIANSLGYKPSEFLAMYEENL